MRKKNEFSYFKRSLKPNAIPFTHRHSMVQVTPIIQLQVFCIYSKHRYAVNEDKTENRTVAISTLCRLCKVPVSRSTHKNIRAAIFFHTQAIYLSTRKVDEAVERPKTQVPSNRAPRPGQLRPLAASSASLELGQHADRRRGEVEAAPAAQLQEVLAAEARGIDEPAGDELGRRRVLVLARGGGRRCRRRDRRMLRVGLEVRAHVQDELGLVREVRAAHHAVVPLGRVGLRRRHRAREVGGRVLGRRRGFEVRSAENAMVRDIVYDCSSDSFDGEVLSC